MFYLSLVNGNKLIRCYGFLPRIIRDGVLCFKFLFLIFSFLTSWSDFKSKFTYSAYSALKGVMVYT